IDRTVKMPPSMLSQSWMGTDIKNDDLLESSNKKDDFNKEITGEFVIEGLPCYRIRLTPKKEVNSIWGKIVIWISKENFLQMQVMYFDEDMELVNTFFGSQVKELDGLLMPTVNTIVPAKKKGHKTKMEITKRIVNLEIDDQIFTTQYIKRLK
ncbi:MAG: outer membrane lipoprotein-sorting protein, partial [Putridiphycobacter sp.]|nr:outer membrane lipoprotein-sorting protein [Putridiphycobacter sp.]